MCVTARGERQKGSEEPVMRGRNKSIPLWITLSGAIILLAVVEAGPLPGCPGQFLVRPTHAQTSLDHAGQSNSVPRDSRWECCMGVRNMGLGNLGKHRSTGGRGRRGGSVKLLLEQLESRHLLTA